MSDYAAFLRGVNLGPTRKISGAELRSIFEDLGFENVATFRTSGNVVFDAARESATKLTGRIEAGLEKATGFEVPVFLRTTREMQALAAAEPFKRKIVGASKGKLQVALLLKKPSAGKQKEVLALASEEDRLSFGARELYWLPSGGTQDSALGMGKIDGLVGPMTMRTMGTIEELGAKCFAD